MELTIQERFTAQVERLTKKMGTKRGNLLHASTGLVGEAGELVDAYKKVWVYNKPLDKENIKEELGDVLFYLVYLMQSAEVEPVFVSGLESHELQMSLDDTRPLELTMTIALTRVCIELDEAIYDNEDKEYLNLPALILGFIEFFAEEIDVTIDDIMEANLYKLSEGPNARYPLGYTDEAAQARADKS